MKIQQQHAVSLFLVCVTGLMTFLLIQKEYFSNGGGINALPVNYVWKRFLHNDSSSSLQVLWNRQVMGSLLILVKAGRQPLVKASTQLTIPILGQTPHLRAEWDSRMNAQHAWEKVRLHGRFEEIPFNIYADADARNLEITVQRDGNPFQRTFHWEKDQNDPKGLEATLHAVAPEMTSLTSSLDVADRMKWQASRVRIHRKQDWMDAYFVESRADSHAWWCAWISLSGEILKFDSSLGIRGYNDEFYGDDNPFES